PTMARQSSIVRRQPTASAVSSQHSSAIRSVSSIRPSISKRTARVVAVRFVVSSRESGLPGESGTDENSISQKLGGKISPVRPDECSQVRIQRESFEEFDVCQGLEDFAVEFV